MTPDEMSNAIRSKLEELWSVIGYSVRTEYCNYLMDETDIVFDTKGVWVCSVTKAVADASDVPYGLYKHRLNVIHSDSDVTVSSSDGITGVGPIVQIAYLDWCINKRKQY